MAMQARSRKGSKAKLNRSSGTDTKTESSDIPAKIARKDVSLLEDKEHKFKVSIEFCFCSSETNKTINCNLDNLIVLPYYEIRPLSLSKHSYFVEQVFRRRAETLSADLTKEFGEIKVSLNPERPRKGSFEVTLNPGLPNEALVWSGLIQGPPRKLKFPESEMIIKEIKNQKPANFATHIYHWMH